MEKEKRSPFGGANKLTKVDGCMQKDHKLAS